MWPDGSHDRRLSVKLEENAGEKPPVFSEANRFHQYCNNCRRVAAEMKMCTGCDSVHYCDKKCQQQSWAEHKVLCNAISQLSKLQNDQINERCSFNRSNSKVVELVGSRCTVRCEIGGQKCEALWDTGAEVSLISIEWLQRNGVTYDIKDVRSLLGGTLKIQAVGK